MFRAQLDEELATKRIRFFRNSSLKDICYRYFVVNDEQLQQFQEDREYGTLEGPNKSYHVYVDDDVDRNSTEYKQLFKLSREIDTVN